MSSSYDHGVKRRKREDYRKGYEGAASRSDCSPHRESGCGGSRRRDGDVSSRMHTGSMDSGGTWSTHGNRSGTKHKYDRHRHHDIHPHRERQRPQDERKGRRRGRDGRNSEREIREEVKKRKEMDGRSRGRERDKSKEPKCESKSSSGLNDDQTYLPASSSRSKVHDGSKRKPRITEQVVACIPDQKSHLAFPGEKLLIQSKEAENAEHLKTGTNTSSFPISPLNHVQTNQPATAVALSSNPAVPGLSNQRQKQEEKKKLLWGDTASKTVKSPWEGLKFANDSKTEKFRKLMGIKNKANTTDEHDRGEGLDKKQEKIFQDLQDQYSIARMATHSQARGAGLGSFSRH